VPERLLVVGGDAAGMSAAAIARRRAPALEVVALERGPYTSYSACGIPYYIGGLLDGPDRLISRSPDEFRQAGIVVHTRCEVTAIDLGARTLKVRDLESRSERTEGFDQLLYATGAEAVTPPVPGAEACDPVRTVDAAERFRARLGRGDGRSAVVIGAGYVGLEMAEALVTRGLEVALVDRNDQVMATLDPDMAAHVQDAAEGVGVQVMLSTAVEEIRHGGHGRPRSVLTSAGELAADHVVLSTGVRPATALAEAAGLEIGETGALRVDDHQRCAGADGVFAAGDCVESWHRVLERPVNVQLGTHANKQGRVAGTNATGGDVAFPGVVGTAVSKICRYEVGRTGIPSAKPRRPGSMWSARPSATGRGPATTRAPARSGSSSWRRPIRAACSAGRSSAWKERRSGSTCSRPACGAACRSASSSCWTSRTRRRSPGSTTRCSWPPARPQRR